MIGGESNQMIQRLSESFVGARVRPYVCGVLMIRLSFSELDIFRPRKQRNPFIE